MSEHRQQLSSSLTEVFPDDTHTCDETLEEGLLAQIGVVLLEVLLGRGDELDGSELVTSLLEPGDNLADQAALDAICNNIVSVTHI